MSHLKSELCNMTVHVSPLANHLSSEIKGLSKVLLSFVEERVRGMNPVLCTISLSFKPLKLTTTIMTALCRCDKVSTVQFKEVTMLPQVVEETPQFNKSAWEGDRGRQRTLLFYQPQVLSIAV